MPEVQEQPKTVRSPGTPPSEESIKRAEQTNKDIFDFDEEVGEEKEEKVEEKVVEKAAPEEKVVEKKEDKSVEDRIADAISEGLSRVQAKPEEKKQEQVKLTPEQEDEILNRFKPSEKLLEMLDSDDKQERLNAIRMISEGAVKQALTMAKFVSDSRVEQLEAQLRGELAPLRQEHQMTAQERGQKEFYDSYPALKDDKFTRFLRMATGDLKDEGYKPTSKEDAMKTIATRAEKYVQDFDPNFKLGVEPAKKTTTTAKTTIPKQPVTSAGGGGGTESTNSGKSSNRSNGTEIFD